MLRRTLAHHAFTGCNPPLMKAIREKLGRLNGGVDLQEATDIVEAMPEADIFGAMFDEITQSHYHCEELILALEELASGHSMSGEATARAAISAARLHDGLSPQPKK